MLANIFVLTLYGHDRRAPKNGLLAPQEVMMRTNTSRSESCRAGSNLGLRSSFDKSADGRGRRSEGIEGLADCAGDKDEMEILKKILLHAQSHVTSVGGTNLDGAGRASETGMASLNIPLVQVLKSYEVSFLL